jgi:hypothetical protein
MNDTTNKKEKVFQFFINLTHTHTHTHTQNI